MSIKLPLETVPNYYRQYVSKVAGYDLEEALVRSNQQLLTLIESVPASKGDHRYQPGKWSIKEVLCHLLDAERIFAYRALRFARNDRQELRGFDDNLYVAESNAQKRELAQLAKEMKVLRLSTLELFRSFTDEMLSRKGIANANEFSVIAIGYIIAGHETHHRLLLEERYLSKES
jgi:uncharacterized damage-inducible protein DinB